MTTPRIQIKSSPTCNIQIYLAGDADIAKNIIQRKAYDKGMCVTVTETEYIYTGGRESGYVIGIINYARFPSSDHDLVSSAIVLAKELMTETFQLSCSVVCPNTTYFLYDGDKKK